MIQKAGAALARGEPVVLYDSETREGEADIIFHAATYDSKKNYYLRKNAGGSIVLAISGEIAHELSIPYLADIFRVHGVKNAYVKTNYADPPPYSLPLNHVNAHTGVTDNDRSLAVVEFEKLFHVQNRRELFEKNFRTPGHLPVCVSRGIENRKGHTELAVELAKQAGITQCVVLCEMLGEGRALTKKQAQDFAKANNIICIEGSEIYGTKNKI